MYYHKVGIQLEALHKFGNEPILLRPIFTFLHFFSRYSIERMPDAFGAPKT